VVSRNSTVPTGVARGSEVAHRRIYASLSGALGLDDVELLSAKQIRLTGELFCEWRACRAEYCIVDISHNTAI